MKKGHYIGKKQSGEILNLIEEFQKESQFGKIKTNKSDRIFNKLITDYLDRLIMGVIYSPLWRYYVFAEIEDLQNEARMHLYKSIIDGKFDKNRGTSLFAFLTAVISNNLRTYTTVKNKHMNKESGAELENVVFMPSMQHKDIIYEDIEDIVEKEIVPELEKFFEKDDKFLKLTKLLKNFFKINKKKFFKKEFIEYSKAITGYSPSLINTFLSNLKKIKSIKNIIREHEENQQQARFKKQ